MDVFYFGQAPVQLLGVYHPPALDHDRLQGVLLCYPFGQEYMRAHRAFRQLAESLAAKGYHVLRFDYRGSGDSSGNIDDVSAEDWLADIATAVGELRDLSGVHAITLVGLRLGALLAAVHAARAGDISRLVLWDPFVSGQALVDEIKKEVGRSPDRKRLSNFLAHKGDIHFNGFCLPPSMQDSLRDLDLLQMRPDCAGILHLATHENPQSDLLRKVWREIEEYEYQLRPAEHDWNYVDHVGGILLPRAALEGVRLWI